MKTKIPEAPVVRYIPASQRSGALVYVRCPFGCMETTPTGRPKKNAAPAHHLHGVGGPNVSPSSGLGSRQSHCLEGGGTYELVDPNGVIVPTTKGVQSWR